MPKSNGEIINRNFADIFSGEMRYVIPFFQRGYVWGSRNWNQLKQDIEEQVLEPAQDDDLAEQEHFFGPVVVAEQSGDPRFKVFDIIDGQQRFTTVYLMLAYFRRRLETMLAKAPQAREHFDAVGRWLINRTAAATGSERWAKTRRATTIREWSVRSAISACANANATRKWGAVPLPKNGACYASRLAGWRSTPPTAPGRGTSPP